MSLRALVCRFVAGTLLLASVSMLAAGYWIPVKAEIAQILLERAWLATRSGHVGARPWPWADTIPVAKLAIPELGATWIVLSGASGRNLAFAPSQLDGSAAPGEPGVMLIAGHRDTHFEILQELRAGATLLLEDPAGAVYRYQVTRTDIVNADTTSLRLDSDVPMLVLSTCYPFNAMTSGGPLRYLVQAESMHALT
jgi:sortase A